MNRIEEGIDNALPKEGGELTGNLRIYADSPSIILNNNDKNYATLPRNNSMQKAVAQFLENGGEFNEGLLIILKDELPALFEQIKSRKEII